MLRPVVRRLLIPGKAVAMSVVDSKNIVFTIAVEILDIHLRSAAAAESDGM